MPNIQEVGIGKVAGLVAAISVIIGAIFTVDARYAHAADVAAINEAQKQITVEHRNELRWSMDQQRSLTLKDRVMEKSLIPPARRSIVDQAMLDAAKDEIKAIEQKWQKQ